MSPNTPLTLQDLIDNPLPPPPEAPAPPEPEVGALDPGYLRRPDAPVTLQDLQQEGLAGTPADPTAGQRFRELGIGFMQGAAESGLLLGSIKAGMKVGAVGGLPGVIGGGIIGGGVGLFAASAVDALIPEVERPDLVFEREGARTAAAAAAFSPVALSFKSAPQGSGLIRRTIGAIGDYARANRGAYFSNEAMVALYAGLAGGAAAQYYGDSPLVRPAAEVGSSFLPTRFAYQLGTNAVRTVKSALNAADDPAYSPATRAYVQDLLTNLIEEAGEDVPSIVRAVDQALEALPARFGGEPPPMTVAQLTGSPLFTKMQSTIALGNAKYSSDTKEMGEAALRAYADIVNKLEVVGDQTNAPWLLQAAAELRQKNFQDQFQTAFNIAQTNAAEKAAKLGLRGSENRAAAGRFLWDEMENVVNIGRQTERQYWDAAIKAALRASNGKVEAIQIAPTRLAAALYENTASPFGAVSPDTVAQELRPLRRSLESLGFSKEKMDAITGLPVTPEYLETRALSQEALGSLDLADVSAVDLIKFRGTLLEKSRSATDPGEKRRYSIMANAILEDLEALPGNFYRDARTFSRTLNDSVINTFAFGATDFSPEVLVQRAFTGGADSTLKRMKEMEAAANFVDPTGAAALSVRDAERKVVNSFISEALDADGNVRLSRLEAFRAQHGDTLRFLGMEDDFADIASAQRAMLDVQDVDSLLARRIKSEKAFASLLEVDDPAIAVAMALSNQKNPVKNFQSLVETASLKGQEGLDGLLSTVYQYAYQSASKTGTFQPQVFNDVFFKPLSANQPSLVRLLQGSKVMPADEAARLRQLTNRMLQVEESLGTQARILDPESIYKPQDAMDDLVFSMLGAKVAGAVGPGGPGSLTFASKTIKATKRFFEGLPGRQRQLLLEEATKNPQLFRQLMSEVTTPQQGRNIKAAVFGSLYSPSVLPTALARYYEPDFQEAQAADVTPRALDMLRQLPPAPTTRGTPNLRLGGDQGPAGEALEQMPTDQGPMPGPTSSSREMFQRLFPNEIS